MQEVSRHKSLDVLQGYVRDAGKFDDHAGEGLLESHQALGLPITQNWPPGFSPFGACHTVWCKYSNASYDIVYNQYDG